MSWRWPATDPNDVAFRTPHVVSDGVSIGARAVPTTHTTRPVRRALLSG
ncbi:hypothetical protein ABZ614_22030 [Streptomyces sp. NPDC013178]